MEKEEIQTDIKRLKSISAVAEQEGGKLLIKSLQKDVVNDLETILSLYRGDEMELRTAAANLKAHLGVLRTLTRSRSQLKLAMSALEAVEKEEQGLE